MNWQHYFSEVKRPIRACLVGSGGFGHSFLTQCMHTSLVLCRVAVDLSVQTAAEALEEAGVRPDEIRICHGIEDARRAWEDGHWIAAARLEDVLELPMDILVEATGNPEAGARHASDALDAGWHVALVTKEVDSVVGVALAHRALQLNRVVTPVDGDQPNLLIGLISWARMIGLDIIAAGKASEYDFVYHADTDTVISNGEQLAVPGFRDAWIMPSRDAYRIASVRSQLCAKLPQRTVPDFCEMQIVANWTGLTPDVPVFHAPILRIPEVPDALRLRSEGGVLESEGVLELFHCLRKPDELSFAGGVFVVVRCTDTKSWDLLAEKGHVLSRDRKAALIYLPRHLLGIESVISIIEAAGLNVASAGDHPRAILDLVGRAEVDLPAGTVLNVRGHHHEISHVAPELRPNQPLGGDAPMPFYLCADHVLRRPVAAGSLICGADVEVDESSRLLALRRYQDTVGEYSK